MTSKGGTPLKWKVPRSPTRCENTFVQVAQSTRKPWNFYYWPTKADSIHEPWAGGNARVDTIDDETATTNCSPRPGGYIAPGIDIVLPGRQWVTRNTTSARRRRHLVPQPL